MDKYVARVFKAVNADFDVKRATFYLSPSTTIKITRQRRGRASRQTYLLTVGTANYLEHKFIKTCKKAGEAFPVKKIQLQRYRS